MTPTDLPAARIWLIIWSTSVLACTGRAGDAQDQGAARLGEERGGDLAAKGRLIFNGGGGSGEGAEITSEDSVAEGGGFGGDRHPLIGYGMAG